MREVSFPLSNAPGEVTLSPTSARLLRLIRIAWYGLALFLVSVFAVGTVLRYSDMQQPCTASLEVCMQTLRLRPVNLQGLESPEAALRFYAIFYTFEQVSIRLLVWAVSAFIFWRRRDDWTALLVSFWLLTLGPPFSEYAAAQHWPWLFVPLMGIGVVSAVCSNLFLFVFPDRKSTRLNSSHGY